MRGGGFRIEVERFDLVEASGDRYEMLFDVWIGSEAPVERVTLVIPGAVELAVDRIAVAEQRDGLDRRGVRHIIEQSKSGGPPIAADCTRASLILEADNGDLLEITVGDRFGAAQARPVSLPEQIVPLALGDDATLDALASREAWPASRLFEAGTAPDAYAIADAIADDFAGLEGAHDLMMHEEGGLWAGTSHRYGFAFKTGLAVADKGRDAARYELMRTIGAALVAFREALGGQAPILVRAASPGDDRQARDALHDAIQARNPASLLLWGMDDWVSDDPGQDDLALVIVAPGLAECGMDDWARALASARMIAMGTPA